MRQKIKTFKGGIHPADKKEQTRDKALENCALPDQFFIPLIQHAGAPAKPIVKVGDLVKEGQLIAEASAFISAAIHAPVTGKIKQIKKHPQAIIIERDKNSAPVIWQRNEKKLDDLSANEIIEQIKNKGIVGLGGAGFPTHIKFLPNQEKPIDTLLINACECEPYLAADYRAMLEKTTLFIDGVKLLQRAAGDVPAIIGIEENKRDILEVLQKQLKDTDKITMQLLAVKYPQGGEKSLIKAVLKREVPRGGLPLDIGVIVANVNTAVAVAEAVYFDKPLIEKIVTIAGDGIAEVKNIASKIGVPIASLIECCGGLKENCQRLIIGGPMMGAAQANLSIPVIKITSGILALTKSEIGDTKISPCIKCGNCVLYCPFGLMPGEIAKFVEHNRLDLAVEAGLLDCVECGACSYECSANRPIVQLIKLGKMLKRTEDSKKKDE